MNTIKIEISKSKSNIFTMIMQFGNYEPVKYKCGQEDILDTIKEAMNDGRLSTTKRIINP